ncbi:MAG: hypothetical protein PCALPYG88_1283 [uncultured Paraburkholderia sp.]|nr:MAG: hypothetical protein PCALPYG08_1346 [uncultured Paraburkholderia sp.]CAH2914119.1 MAG: hypothetical protein PCALPYG88_1283 [uncultured Paraburkholderia sp.]
MDGRLSSHPARERAMTVKTRPVSITGPDGTVAATTPRESSAASAAIDRRQQDRNFINTRRRKP